MPEDIRNEVKSEKKIEHSLLVKVTRSVLSIMRPLGDSSFVTSDFMLLMKNCLPESKYFNAKEIRDNFLSQNPYRTMNAEVIN